MRKYCRLALKGSPTVLLLLFIDGDHVIERTALGADLQALAPAFVSRRAGRSFLGYVDAQRRGLVGERHAARSRELSSTYGYDTKYAMHALRIAHQGQELLRTGRITLPIAEPELRDEPDRDAVDAFLVEAYQRVWACEQPPR